MFAIYNVYYDFFVFFSLILQYTTFSNNLNVVNLSRFNTNDDSNEFNLICSTSHVITDTFLCLAQKLKISQFCFRKPTSKSYLYSIKPLLHNLKKTTSLYSFRVNQKFRMNYCINFYLSKTRKNYLSKFYINFTSSMLLTTTVTHESAINVKLPSNALSSQQELSSKNNNSQYSIFFLFLLTARFKKYYDNFSLLYILFYTIFKQLSDNSLQKLKLIERFLQIARQTPLSKMVKISYFRGHTPASARGLLCLNYAFL